MKKDVQQGEVTGEVFTRPEVVAYMLNSVRHCGKFKSLVGLRVLEPSCGDRASPADACDRARHVASSSISSI